MGSDRITGATGQLFAEPRLDPDETSFRVDNTSAAYYDSVYYKRHKADLQPVPAPVRTSPRMDLSEILDAGVLTPIKRARRISFHAVGDTGAAKTKTQGVSTAIAHQAGVADRMAADVAAGGPDAPACFFHLGDVVYEFGEAHYYYDQFYEPYRNYDRPIFAIPGNHDGSVYGGSDTAPQVPSLAAFLQVFCAPQPGPSPLSGGLVRSTMNQPGVYFTLDCPFVSIIGLYTNVLEGPGVISSEGGVYPAINDDQLTFLTDELARLRPDRQAGKRAVVLATHHPPTSVDSTHGGTLGLDRDIETACTKSDLWPDAVLSGHAHLYQRFTRVTADGQQIPYVVCGAGGYSETRPARNVPVGATDGPFTLAVAPIVKFGYLTVTVDQKALRLTITYNPDDREVQGDSVAVDLKTRQITV
jgi:hypothetical protein